MVGEHPSRKALRSTGLTKIEIGAIKPLMNVSVVRTAFALLMVMQACGMQVKTPSWYPPQRTDPGYYYGTGEGPSYFAARTQALAGLCQSIHVNIKTGTEVIQQESVSGTGENNRVFFHQLVKTVTRAGARCSFKGPASRLIHEIHADRSGSRYYVMLRMSIAGYIHFLARRTVSVVVRPDRFSTAAGRMVQVVVRDLMDNGFVVVDKGARTPNFAAKIQFDPRIEPTGVSGLKIGVVQPVYTVQNMADSSIVKRVAPGVIRARGFSDSMIVDTLAKQAAEALQKALK